MTTTPKKETVKIKSRQILPLDKRHTGEIKPSETDPYSEETIEALRTWFYIYQKALLAADKELIELKASPLRYTIYVPNLWKVFVTPEMSVKPSHTNFDKWAHCLKNYKIALKIAEEQIEEILDKNSKA